MNKRVYVTAKFLVKGEKLAEAQALMQSLTEKTRQNEQGCIEYCYLQNTENILEFTSWEIWETETEENKHWDAPYVQDALKRLPDLLDVSPEIIKWKSN